MVPFTSYVSRGRSKPRLIFSRINGPIVSQPLWIFMFFFLQSSSLLFSITRSSSFSVMHVSVNIKKNVEKDTTLLLFFLSKSPGGHAISFRCIWVAIPVDWIIWHWYACGADGRSGGRAVFSHVIFLPMLLRCARESSAMMEIDDRKTNR